MLGVVNVPVMFWKGGTYIRVHVSKGVYHIIYLQANTSYSITCLKRFLSQPCHSSNNPTIMVDIDALEPQIWRILSAPDTDLTTISAKRVRRQLLEIEPSLSPAFLKENKEGLDAIISRVFDQVSEGMAGRGSEEVDEMVVAHSRPVTKRKRKVEHERYAEADNDDDDGVSASLSPKKTKKAVKKPERQLTDAEIARQLSSEINGRSRRSTVGNVRMGTNGSSRKGRGIKSSELVETDEETGEKRGGGKAKGGFAKEYALRFAVFSLFLSL